MLDRPEADAGLFSMSQIGFIPIGIGMQGLLVEGRELAVHGTLLHMVNHSMIKLVLFMAAGVIFMNTHALGSERDPGYGRNKPLLKVILNRGTGDCRSTAVWRIYQQDTAA